MSRIGIIKAKALFLSVGVILAACSSNDVRSSSGADTTDIGGESGADGSSLDVHRETTPSGAETKTKCPEAAAKITGVEREYTSKLEVAPRKTVLLKSKRGERSLAVDDWVLVRKPHGSTAQVEASDKSGQPELFLDVAGTYKLQFRLEAGSACQISSTVVVEAIPASSIAIYMTWRTPSDEDKTNDCGTDVDLHYLNSRGDWGHARWDIRPGNETADWGASGSAGDPTLVETDSDGLGPEVLTHNPGSVPEQSYRVGVHYDRAERLGPSGGPMTPSRCPDHEPQNYGPVTVSVRVYVDGDLAYQALDEKITQDKSFWEPVRVDWPGGQVSPMDRFRGSLP